MTQPCFACDAMLGGLAKWLRAAGYDASSHPDIDDWDLIRHARQTGSVLLTSDSGIFRVGIVRDGDVPALLIPTGLTKQQQLAFVLDRLGLIPLDPRCMACGGTLAERGADDVAALVPPRVLRSFENFWQCLRCGQVFWPGTHWQRIESVLSEVSEEVDGG